MPNRYQLRHNPRTWSMLRAYWATQLPMPCWRCGNTINPTDQWQLGHMVDLARGGTDEHAAPEHRLCNESAGARLGNHRRRRIRRDKKFGRDTQTLDEVRTLDLDALQPIDDRFFLDQQEPRIPRAFHITPVIASNPFDVGHSRVW